MRQNEDLTEDEKMESGVPEQWAFPLEAPAVNPSSQIRCIEMTQQSNKILKIIPHILTISEESETDYMLTFFEEAAGLYSTYHRNRSFGMISC